MLTRQTFYIPSNLSQQLRAAGYELNKKLSSIVSEALRAYLDQQGKTKKKQKNSLLKYAGKIKSFHKADPLLFQKQIRSEWD